MLDEEVEDAEVGQEGEESSHDPHGVATQIVSHDEGGSFSRGSQFKTEEGLGSILRERINSHFPREELFQRIPRSSLRFREAGRYSKNLEDAANYSFFAGFFFFFLVSSGLSSLMTS